MVAKYGGRIRRQALPSSGLKQALRDLHPKGTQLPFHFFTFELVPQLGSCGNSFASGKAQKLPSPIVLFYQLPAIA